MRTSYKAKVIIFLWSFVYFAVLLAILAVFMKFFSSLIDQLSVLKMELTNNGAVSLILLQSQLTTAVLRSTFITLSQMLALKKDKMY